MLTDRLSEYVSACFTGIWIESHEHDDALAEIAQLCRQENWQLASWDINRGLRYPGQTVEPAADSSPDPLSGIRALTALASPDSSALLVLTNFHRFLGSAEIVQALIHQITAGKQNRTFVIISGPAESPQIPTELEKLMIVNRARTAKPRTTRTDRPQHRHRRGELPDHQQWRPFSMHLLAGLTRY